jgi:hypothetical protein
MDGSTTTERHFHDADCGYAPGLSRRALTIGAVVLAVILAIGLLRRPRRAPELDV